MFSVLLPTLLPVIPSLNMEEQQQAIAALYALQETCQQLRRHMKLMSSRGEPLCTYYIGKLYQGLTDEASPKVLEQFLTHHQCNYYCGLMGLRPLKPTDFLQQPSKMKASRSPLLSRKAGATTQGGAISPQLQRKAGSSPQPGRKLATSPKVPRRAAGEGTGDDTGSGGKHKTVEIPKVVRMR